MVSVIPFSSVVGLIAADSVNGTRMDNMKPKMTIELIAERLTIVIDEGKLIENWEKKPRGLYSGREEIAR